jgi:hypothetical protein
MGGGYAGCSAVAVVVIEGRTTSRTYRGTYRSIAEIVVVADVASAENHDRPTDKTTSTAASLLGRCALGVAPAVATRLAKGRGAKGRAGNARAHLAKIENFAGKTRLGVRSARALRTAIRFRLPTRIHTGI